MASERYVWIPKLTEKCFISSGDEVLLRSWESGVNSHPEVANIHTITHKICGTGIFTYILVDFYGECR